MALLTPSARARARARRVFAPIVLLLALGVVSSAPAAPALEYAVKANYLYKFGPFVEWPASVFVTPSAPFNVCVMGRDPFGKALDEAVRGQTVNGHPVAVRRLQHVAGAADCHVLYLATSGMQKPADALRLLRGAPVLTVTDAQQGVGGGMIHFVLQDGRVRFTIDAQAARASGLVLSSKLLGLAVASPRRGG